MDAFVNALIIAGLILVLLLLVYLIDRVNTIEKETRTIQSSAASAKSATPPGPFAGLSGRRLWDAVTGSLPPGRDPGEWSAMRDRYALVLQLHIESVFEEGQRDAQRGLMGEPKNPRIIACPHGNIESWLPVNQINTIYQCGLSSVGASEDALMGLRATLNDAGRHLYQKAGLTPIPIQSDLILPGPLPPLPPLTDVEPQVPQASAGAVQTDRP